MRLSVITAFAVVCALAVAAYDSPPAPAALDVQAIVGQTENLRPGVLEMALDAYRVAYLRGVVRRPVLTVIDYELPSYERRLWVIDITNRRVLYEEWVAHGMGNPRGSGGTMEEALSFSNSPGTLKSSLGLFVTAETYRGKHGYSLKLDGLEPGVNDAARERLIVVHSADYVTRDRAAAHLVGRSWGCPVIRPKVARNLIDSIKNGSVLWIYYPESSWLKASKFLGDE